MFKREPTRVFSLKTLERDLVITPCGDLIDFFQYRFKNTQKVVVTTMLQAMRDKCILR